MVAAGSTIALISTRPGVMMFYRTGSNIKVYSKAVDGKAKLTVAEDVQPLKGDAPISTKSNIAATRRDPDNDSRQARVFYQGTDKYLNEFSINSDGTVAYKPIDSVNDSAKEGTSLAAVVQNDADKTQDQISNGANMPDVLFYQGIDVYFVTSTEPGVWENPIQVSAQSAKPNTTIQAYIGTQAGVPRVYVTFIDGQAPERFVRYFISIDELCSNSYASPPFSPGWPDMKYWQPLQGRFASICVPAPTPTLGQVQKLADAFRFYAQLSVSNSKIFEGTAQPSSLSLTSSSISLNQGTLNITGKNQTQIAAVYQPDPNQGGTYTITVVWEDNKTLSAVTFSGKWDAKNIAGSSFARKDAPAEWVASEPQDIPLDAEENAEGDEGQLEGNEGKSAGGKGSA